MTESYSTSQQPDALTRVFGKQVVNYFSGSPLNRVAFLRDNHTFLDAAFFHPSTAILLLDADLRPLIKTNQRKLGFVTTEEAKPLFLADMQPFSKSEEDEIKNYSSNRKTGPLVLFLGLKEKLDENEDGENNLFKWKNYRGRPFFAVHLSEGKGTGVSAQSIKTVNDSMEKKGLSWLSDPRSMYVDPPGDAAIYAIARHVLDWNLRNPFCASCGSATMAVHAGWKRVCPVTDAYTDPPTERPACPSRGRVSNVTFPRTDPTVIAAVINSSLTRVLLGRQKRWPECMYSTLAGFVEPGESLEEAVTREVWEESGVSVSNVQLHSSQPWPFPAGLMVGALAVAKPGDGEKIDLGHDPELQDAQWFELKELKEALENGSNALSLPPKPGREGKLRLPPREAIANRLIESAVQFCESERKFRDNGIGEARI